MRVVATKSFKTYFQMVCIDVSEGDELDGDFGDFLVAGGAPVAPAAADDPTPEDGPVDELDISGTAAEILDWVYDDPERAAAAHAAESAKDKPRSTLLKSLETITAS